MIIYQLSPIIFWIYKKDTIVLRHVHEIVLIYLRINNYLVGNCQKITQPYHDFVFNCNKAPLECCFVHYFSSKSRSIAIHHDPFLAQKYLLLSLN